MTSKKWVIGFLSISIVSLVVFAGIMYITDPLLQYGTENGFFTYYEYSEMESNPGIAKNYEYDAVMVGTSMIENTDVQECNKLFGCNMVRLPYSGGTCYNMKTILDVCFRSDNDIETVYWELDEFQLFSAHDQPRYPLPMYLYRDDHWQDLSYLLNLDIFYHYGMNSFLGTLRGEHQKAAREGETFFGDFSAECTLKRYTRPEVSATDCESDHYFNNIDLNMQNNILPLLEANPETEFVFFMVPFSILYWDKEIRQGTFEATMTGVEYAIGQLLEYDNVRVYFYHDEWEIAENLDNYKDYSHYGKWINSYMTQAMSNDDGRMTIENYRDVLFSMKTYINNYDFEEIFSTLNRK